MAVMRRSLAPAAFAALLAVVAGCGGANPTPSPSPAPSPGPTPTPVVAPVVSPEDAASRVIATNPRFAGAIRLTPGVIGATKWWTAEPLADGSGYRVELTIGWGDCPAGCISRHAWLFEVHADGALALLGETGEPLPEVLPG